VTALRIRPRSPTCSTTDPALPNQAPFQPTDAYLNEGDVIAAVPFAKWTGTDWKVNSKRAVITSHGCACEDYRRHIEAGQTSKARKVVLHVAPLAEVRDVPEEKRQIIRAGEMWRYFYLTGQDGVLADHLVDLDAEQAIPAEVLQGLTKIARIADWQWQALLIHITVNRWGRSAEDIFGAARAQELRTA
jgi:hypothetical protein